MDELIPPLLAAARDAGTLIMSYYRQGHAVERKEDASPVTEADKAADRLIVAVLESLEPGFTIVSEEGEKPDVTHAPHFWLVDPLDGTRSFIRGTGYFTVNIGLIENGAPVLGVIYDPVNDRMYWGTPSGAFLNQGNAKAFPIRVRKRQLPGGTALISHMKINPNTDEYLAANGITERLAHASSIKFCMLAEGKADIYARFGPTMEWDTAAGHAIVNAAGGGVTAMDGSPFLYGKPGFLNGNFVASGG